MIAGTTAAHALGALRDGLSTAAAPAAAEASGTVNTISSSFRQHVGQLNGVTVHANDAREGVGQLRIGILRGAEIVDDPTEQPLFDALAQRGVDVQWIEGPRTSIQGTQLLYDSAPMQHFDAIIPRYPRHEGAVLDWLRDHGTPVLNDTVAMGTTADKLKSDAAMAAHDVPRIPTFWARSADDADAALAQVDGEICVKPYDGEGGNGVEFFTSRADAKRHIEQHFANSDTMLSVQPKVSGARVRWHHPELGQVESGMDYRVLATKDRYGNPFVKDILQRIGAAGSDKSNLDAGGWGRVVDPTREHVPAGLIDTALRAFKSVPGQYEVGGIDVMAVGRDIDAPVTDHSAQSFVTTEFNSAPGFPDRNYGTKFTEAIADRAIILAQQSRSGTFVPAQ